MTDSAEERSSSLRTRLGVRAPLHWAPTLGRVAVTTFSLALLFWWIPIDEVAGAIGQIGVARWAGVVALFALIHGLAAIKWTLLVRASGTRLSVPVAIRAHAAGLFANIWLPSIVGGDLVRAGIAARGGRQLAGPTAAGIADRILDLAALVALAAAGLLLAPRARDDMALHVLELAVLVLGMGCIGGFVALRVVPPGRLPQRLAHAVRRLREAAGALVSRRRTAGLALLISLATQGALVAVNDLLGAPIGIEAPLAVWAVAWPLAKIAAFLPVSLGGIGVREAALTGLLATFGVDPALAVAQGLLWRSGLMALGLLGGALALFVPSAADSALAPEGPRS